MNGGDFKQEQECQPGNIHIDCPKTRNPMNQ